ncbi:hypothetical protein [Luteibaculum oceani]|uniref:Oligosaccharide repeat unit polymerase n=1 Tax=Luteibaculum oceani TaxID=1294296 RepID=A0A5C6V8L8_9FLAO|nr:hypothetical protein [Luteibaculum oceani]TXC81399.1 hypothetical protein FRX97_05175 [Luteibaculum oceani]
MKNQKVNYWFFYLLPLFIWFLWDVVWFYRSFIVIFFSISIFNVLKELNKGISILNVILLLHTIQFLIGPMLAYYMGFKGVLAIYQMQIPEVEYFSYTLPAMIAFALGMGCFRKSNSFLLEKKEEFKLETSILDVFLIVGIVLLNLFFQIFVIEISFLFYLIFACKYVFLIKIILSRRRFPFMVFFLVFGSSLLNSFKTGMFHDLLIWFIFVSLIIAFKFQFTLKYKILGILAFIGVVIVLQLGKLEFRKSNDLSTFSKVILNSEEFVTDNLLRSSITRFNQGYILTHVMSNVPSNIPYSNGSYMLDIVEAAIFPRFLAPNKLKSGDQEVFTKYSGLMLNKNTSMALGSLSDAYINFGMLGGYIFMFFYGKFFGLVNTFLATWGDNNQNLKPFVFLVFLFAVRPDCDLQTILGHVFKVVVVLIFLGIVNSFSERTNVMSSR